MRTYLIDGTPDFSGGSYFEPDDSVADGAAGGEVKSEQRALHVVDSYSMSVTLCLATLGFLRVYRQGLRSQRMQRRGRRTGAALLTAADRGHGRPAPQLHRQHLRPRRAVRPDAVRDGRPGARRHRDPRP